MQSLGSFGIGHLVESVLDLNYPNATLRGITPAAGEHIHEVIDATRRGFQLVAIKPIDFEMHERIACLREARAERAQVSQNLRARRPG